MTLLNQTLERRAAASRAKSLPAPSAQVRRAGGNPP